MRNKCISSNFPTHGDKIKGGGKSHGETSGNTYLKRDCERVGVKITLKKRGSWS